MERSIKSWGFNAPKKLSVAAFGFFLLVGCQGNTPLVNEAALQEYRAAQAHLAPSGPFSGNRETQTHVADDTNPATANAPQSESASPGPAESENPSEESSESTPNSPPENSTLPGEAQEFLSGRGLVGPLGTHISIRAFESTLLSPQETRPVIFLPPATHKVGFIRRGDRDVTLQTDRNEPIGDTFTFNCNPEDGACYRMKSTQSDARSLEMAVTWNSEQVPLVRFRHGMADRADGEVENFIEIRHNPNYAGAPDAEIFDDDPPPLKWKAFLFSKNFERFDRQFNTADLFFRETEDPDEYQIELIRFQSETSPGPWKTMRVNLEDELPWRRTTKSKHTKGMEIFLSDDTEYPSMAGKIFYHDGAEVWFIAFPDQTLTTLAYAGK